MDKYDKAFNKEKKEWLEEMSEGDSTKGILIRIQDEKINWLKSQLKSRDKIISEIALYDDSGADRTAEEFKMELQSQIKGEKK